MASRRSATLASIFAVGLAASAHGAFVAQPDGSLLESFNDGVVDTVTWSTAAIGSPHVATETGSELKLVQTVGFNGAYSTKSPLNLNLVEPATAGNNNNRVRAIMRRRDTEPTVGMGLSITTNVNLRTCGDVGDYACMFWAVSDPGIYVEVRNAGYPPNVNMFAGVGQPGYGTRAPYGNPVGADLTGKTRYLFEIDWTTYRTIDVLIGEILGPDQNNDLAVDIVDFGAFAGDFGKSGSWDPPPSDPPMGVAHHFADPAYPLFDGVFSDFDDSGVVDIVDFGILAGAFGQGDPTVIYDQTLDWSFEEVSPGVPNPDMTQDTALEQPSLCVTTECWPMAMGVQIYAHQPGTLWVDYVEISGGSSIAAAHNPEPASLALMGVAMLALMRRRRIT